MKNKNKGFTLTEILLVLVIAAAIVISAFIIYPKVQSSQKVTAEINNISALTTGIRNLYGTQTSYSNISATVVLNAGIVPDNMLPTNPGLKGHMYNSWNGEVLVWSATKPGLKDGSLFYIMYNGVPKKECIDLLTKISGNDTYFFIIVNGSTLVGPSNQFSVEKTIELCNLDKNVIKFDAD